MKKLMTLLVFGALLAGMSGCHVGGMLGLRLEFPLPPRAPRSARPTVRRRRSHAMRRSQRAGRLRLRLRSAPT